MPLAEGATDWDFFGGTTCDNADVTISNSKTLELELCFPTASVVDEALPTEIDVFTFPNENDIGIDWRLTVTDSTIDGWGVSIPPQSEITIRDAGAATVSVIVGSPWEGQTVVLDGLDSKHYGDQTWEIVDSILRFVNVTIYGWEANVFGRNNTIVIRNSNYSGSSISGGPNTLIVENSVRSRSIPVWLTRTITTRGCSSYSDDTMRLCITASEPKSSIRCRRFITVG